MIRRPFSSEGALVVVVFTVSGILHGQQCTQDLGLKCAGNFSGSIGGQSQNGYCASNTFSGTITHQATASGTYRDFTEDSRLHRRRATAAVQAVSIINGLARAAGRVLTEINRFASMASGFARVAIPRRNPTAQREPPCVIQMAAGLARPMRVNVARTAYPGLAGPADTAAIMTAGETASIHAQEEEEASATKSGA